MNQRIETWLRQIILFVLHPFSAEFPASRQRLQTEIAELGKGSTFFFTLPQKADQTGPTGLTNSDRSDLVNRQSATPSSPSL